MTDVVKEYVERIDALEGVSFRKKGRKLDFHASFDDDPKVAIKQIRAVQIQLRAMKREVAAKQALLKQQFQMAKAKATYKPGVGGALLGAKYRGAMRTQGAESKRRMTEAKNEATQPYDEVKNFIDQILATLDVKKVELGG